MELEGARIAVTGATGFIGRNVAIGLLARGAVPVAVVRTPAKAAPLAAAGAEVRAADVGDVDALTRAFDGVDGVVACAGAVSLGRGSVADVIATNVQGTTHQLQACARAGVRRVVMMSSAEAYAPRADHVYVEDAALRTEDDPVSRFNVYFVSKGISERQAWATAAGLDLDLTTLRPAAVHGAFDRGTLTLWFRRLLSLPVTVFPTHVRYPSVYVGDLAEAALRALERPAASGRAYNVCGGDDHTFWDLKNAWRDAGGPSPWLVLPVPVPVHRRFPIDRITADLDWSNRPLVDGFRQTFALEAAALADASSSRRKLAAR
ncbi:MAG: NAD(P)-dependent oxidoreductase [Alphaproteobacteria bacterium]|nr:NAD(P)-dependent oxidoreductase [Alphaproteobacteria bacterium]